MSKFKNWSKSKKTVKIQKLVQILKISPSYQETSPDAQTNQIDQGGLNEN